MTGYDVTIPPRVVFPLTYHSLPRRAWVFFDPAPLRRGSHAQPKHPLSLPLWLLVRGHFILAAYTQRNGYL